MKIWVFPEEINIVLKNRLKSMGLGKKPTGRRKSS
jgi:hypothetical protein